MLSDAACQGSGFSKIHDRRTFASMFPSAVIVGKTSEFDSGSVNITPISESLFRLISKQMIRHFMKNDQCIITLNNEKSKFFSVMEILSWFVILGNGADDRYRINIVERIKSLDSDSEDHASDDIENIDENTMSNFQLDYQNSLYISYESNLKYGSNATSGPVEVAVTFDQNDLGTQQEEVKFSSTELSPTCSSQQNGTDEESASVDRIVLVAQINKFTPSDGYLDLSSGNLMYQLYSQLCFVIEKNAQNGNFDPIYGILSDSCNFVFVCAKFTAPSTVDSSRHIELSRSNNMPMLSRYMLTELRATASTRHILTIILRCLYGVKYSDDELIARINAFDQYVENATTLFYESDLEARAPEINLIKLIKRHKELEAELRAKDRRNKELEDRMKKTVEKIEERLEELKGKRKRDEHDNE